MGVPVARIEFLDAMAMKAVSEFSDLSYAIAPTLFMEFHGSPASVLEHAQNVGDIAAECGAVDFHSAVELEERLKLWVRATTPSSPRWRCGRGAGDHHRCLRADLATCRVHRRDRQRRRGAGVDRNHCGSRRGRQLPRDVDVRSKRRSRGGRRSRGEPAPGRPRALEMDGTCTGEHGIGLRKMGSLAKELGGRRHASSETGDRSTQHHEPGKSVHGQGEGR